MTAKRKPKILWVCSRPISVSFTDEEFVHEGERVFATFDRFSSQILVDGSVDEANQRSSFLHEVFHAIIHWTIGSDLAQVAPGKIEELFCRSAETAWFDVLRDPRNRWFAEYLLADD